MDELDFDKPENTTLLFNLYAYARGLFFRMYKKEPNHKMKNYEDYVHDALMKHFKSPEVFDPKRGSLEMYLKYYIIRQLMSNDFPSHVKKQYAESFGVGAGEKLSKIHIIKSYDDDEIQEGSWQGNRIDEIDDKIIFAAIEKELPDEGAGAASLIYLAVFHDNFRFSERAEICEACNITEAEFDKGKKRLLTVMRRVFKDLKLIN